MSLPTEQRIWLLRNHPKPGPVTAEVFQLEKRPLPALEQGQALIAVEYFSNDPAFRYRIEPGGGIELGDSIRGNGVAKVLKSTGKWKEGSRVFTYTGWADYSVVNDDDVQRYAAELPGKPWASISPLGFSSITAYQAIFEILKPSTQQTILIDAAAGSVGVAAIQFAKIAGAKRIVGIAGGAEKCKFVEEHGADQCVDYRAPDFEEQLAKALPDGADRFLDMVGGKVYDLGIAHMTLRGVVGIIGAVSTYTGGNEYVPKNHVLIPAKRLTIYGFTMFDYFEQTPEALEKISGWIKEGKFDGDDQTVVDAPLEDLIQVWNRLFTGTTPGKLITHLVPSKQ